MSGALAYQSGLAAEDAVARFYQAQGHQIAAKRWRSEAGEIDLIAKKGDSVVFIEVKKSKTLAGAAVALSERQIARIYSSAAVFLDTQPKGQDSDARFDVALVDGAGEIRIVQNAFLP